MLGCCVSCLGSVIAHHIIKLFYYISTSDYCSGHNRNTHHTHTTHTHRHTTPHNRPHTERESERKKQTQKKKKAFEILNTLYSYNIEISLPVNYLTGGAGRLLFAFQGLR